MTDVDVTAAEQRGHGERRLEIREIRKAFGATVALAGVSLDLFAGEVHALLGANGSGKSTLIKILAGVETGDAGEIIVRGRELRARNMDPTLATECQLWFVHQQGSTFGSLTVAENLTAGIGFPRRRTGAIDWPRLRRDARATLERYGIDAEPDEPLENLRPVTQQMISIARLFHGRTDAGAGVLVLDEPTATLPPREVALLHGALKRHVADGQAILYVTHRLDELAGFVDRATILREGRVADRLDQSEINHERVVEAMLGAASHVKTASTSASPKVNRGGVRLKVRDLHGGAVRRAAFDVRSGEIVGLAGLVGSGRSSLLEILFGVSRAEGGTVHLDGEPLPWRGGVPHPAVALVPEDRVRDGAFMELTLLENLLAASTSRYWRRLRVDHRAERRAARFAIREQGIVAESESSPFGTLSGGNQQKAILGRWLMREPILLLLDEPTQGVDVGARAAIHDMVRRAVVHGSIAIVASSDVDELAMLCHRIVIMADGETITEVVSGELSPEQIERLSYRSGTTATAAAFPTTDSSQEPRPNV